MRTLIRLGSCFMRWQKIGKRITRSCRWLDEDMDYRQEGLMGIAHSHEPSLHVKAN